MSGLSPLAAIVSLAGPTLSADERELLAELPPAGVILFARNGVDPEQLATLTVAVRAAAGDPALPILIDQEGGRVARLRPPHWQALPPMATLGRLEVRRPGKGIEAALLAGRVIAADLAAVGITVACAPVLDVGHAYTTSAIGDRAFAADPGLVGELGRALADGLRAGGVAPVMKHIPGHGRARQDSHAVLPRVDEPLDGLRSCDFLPFRANAGLPLAMTAHVVYESIDPAAPATLSARVIGDIIRGEIGFSGVLITDDLGMGALSGPLEDRARAALAAGCDVALYCGGEVSESRAVLASVPPLAGEVLSRLREAVPPPGPARDEAALASRALDRLMGEA